MFHWQRYVLCNYEFIDILLSVLVSTISNFIYKRKGQDLSININTRTLWSIFQFVIMFSVPSPVSVSKQSLIISLKSSVSNHQSQVICPQSWAFRHQSPIVSHPSLVVSLQSSVSSCQSPIISIQYPVISLQLSVSSHQYPIISLCSCQSSISSHQSPVLSLHQPPISCYGRHCKTKLYMITNSNICIDVLYVNMNFEL